ncbi:MAG TPA: exosortase-associated EpsI family protein [Verrucomicrobiae bacterium]|nr:exosortase-associated EpsI family protein [Verrucomicrobiae bacterium]
MKRQEGVVAFVVLGLIALAATAIHFGKPRLGNPGLAFEKAALTNEHGKIVREERVRFPENVAGFRAISAPINDVEVTNLPPDTSYGRKIYWDKEGFMAQMTAVMMKTDRTSIHRPQVCITGQGWKIEKTEVIDIPVASPAPYVLKATCLTSKKKDERTGQLRSNVYIYWFVAEHQLVPGHPDALWAISQDLITSGVLHPWAYVSVYAPCPPGQERVALARAKRLIASAVPEFQLTPAPAAKQTAFHQKSAPLQ